MSSLHDTMTGLIGDSVVVLLSIVMLIDWTMIDVLEKGVAGFIVLVVEGLRLYYLIQDRRKRIK